MEEGFKKSPDVRSEVDKTIDLTLILRENMLFYIMNDSSTNFLVKRFTSPALKIKADVRHRHVPEIEIITSIRSPAEASTVQ